MSSMDIDQPLEDIIKAKGRTKKGKNGGKLQSRGNIQPRARHPAPAKATPVPKARPVGAEASKIIISNLPGDVNEAAVRDLMQSTVGPVKSVQLHYTSAGKSTGVATVLFRNKGDGNKAHAAYHNRMVDNQRPMKVELAFDPSQLQSLASRVAPAPAPRNAPRNSGSSRPSGRGRPRQTRPARKTADELDAEMSAYKENNAA